MRFDPEIVGGKICDPGIDKEDVGGAMFHVKHFHFPTQNCSKMRLSTSSGVVSPTTSPKASKADRISKAMNSREAPFSNPSMLFDKLSLT